MLGRTEENKLKFHGCFYHFAQCIWKRIQKDSLAILYFSNDNFKKFVRMILALPFVKPEEIPMLFDHIVENNWPADVPENHVNLLQFLKYVYHNWIKTNTEEWSVFHVMDHRTNNHLESRHSKLLKFFGEHPSLWDFLRLLIKFHSDQMNAELSQRQGTAVRKRKKANVNSNEERL